MYIKADTIGRYLRRALMMGLKSCCRQYPGQPTGPERRTSTTNSQVLDRFSPLRRLMIATNNTMLVIDAKVWSKKNFIRKQRNPDVCARGVHRACFSFSLSWLGKESSCLEENSDSHARGEKSDFSRRALNASLNSAREGKPGYRASRARCQ